MAGFLFRLEMVDGEAADPPTVKAAVPDWRPGDSIHCGGRTLRLVGKRDDDARPASSLDRGGSVLETRAVGAEQVTLIPRCAECEAAWLPADEERWRAYLGGDELDESPEVVFYCAACVEREFGDRETHSTPVRQG